MEQSFTQSQALARALVAEFRRRVMEESVPRLKKCLAELTEAEVWQRPNPNSNAVGNLVLHLCGNAQQWVLTGIGGAPDHRDRQSEFDCRGGIGKAELVAKVDAVMLEINALLDAITPEELLRIRPVQVYEESGLTILVHVLEHFSYHVGQMTYFVKAIKDMDLGYYEDDDL